MSEFEQYLATCLDDVTPSRVKDAMQYSLMTKDLTYYLLH